MNDAKNNFWRKDPWSYKELLAMLALVFLLVPWLIENHVQARLQQFFHHDLYAGTLTGLIMGIVFTAGVYWIALVPKKKSWSAVGMRPFPAQYWIFIGLWSIAVLVSAVLILLVMSWFGGSYENDKTESIQSQVSAFSILIGILSAGVVSPVYEEIFYRGFLYRWFRTRMGKGWGLILSSAVFTAAHIPTYNTLALNFLSGLIFAWTYERTRSILPGILIHGLTNTIAVLLTAFA